jgi:hypothetical protein
MGTSLIGNTDAGIGGFQREFNQLLGLETRHVLCSDGRMRRLTTGFCLLLVTACGGSPSGPTTPLNTEFTLAPTQTMHIDGTSMAVRFNQVTGDSRCPADAVCILGGSADVEITAESDSSKREYALRTGDMKPVQHEGLTITLVQLVPYPFSARTIQPGEYRATLKVTR